MIYFKNDLNNVLKQLKKDLDYSESSLKAWEAVTIDTKKDGSEYANVKRALNGAALYDYIGHKNAKMYITFKTAFNGVQTDEIYTYGYLDELPDDDERKKEYRRQVIRQSYTFSAEEMRQAIKKHIEYKKWRIENLKHAIEIAPAVFKEYREAISKANAILTEKADFHNGRDFPDRTLSHLLEEAF